MPLLLLVISRLSWGRERRKLSLFLSRVLFIDCVAEICNQIFLSSQLHGVFRRGLQFFCFNFFQYYVNFFPCKLFYIDISLLINNFWISLSVISGGFRADSWNVLSTSELFLFGLLLLVLLSRCSTFRFFFFFHLLSAMVFVIVLLQPNFYFIDLVFECILILFFLFLYVLVLWAFSSFTPCHFLLFVCFYNAIFKVHWPSG